MSELFQAPKSLLFISLLYQHNFRYKIELSKKLEKSFGEFSIFVHPFFPMKDYYSKEMGKNLKREFIFFTTPIDREELLQLKLFCVEVEKLYSLDHQRQVNLDPGLINLENTVISTGKSYNHRIYIEKGVYFELVYLFKANKFGILPWTYPDYSHPEIIKKFEEKREFLKLSVT